MVVRGVRVRKFRDARLHATIFAAKQARGSLQNLYNVNLPLEEKKFTCKPAEYHIYTDHRMHVFV